jgi:AcrR family transcriptional regulator
MPKSKKAKSEKEQSEKSAPRLPLSRARILDQALQIADRSGIAALSMRKLADDLGVKAMSLYNHVQNKDDIIDGIVDQIVSEIELPDPQSPWQSAMRQRANSVHSVLLRHPWATLELVSRVNVGPAMLRYIDATLGCLCEAGFSLEMADHAWNAIDSHIYGYTLQELNFPFKPEEYSAAAESFIARIPANKYPYMHALSQKIITGHYDGLNDFEFGLDLILEGLSQQLKKTS